MSMLYFQKSNKTWARYLEIMTKTLENEISKHWKIQLDISFVSQCKKVNIIPIFAKVNAVMEVLLMQI